MTVAELNDAFRRSFTGGEVVVTSGISALPWEMQAGIIERVRSFEAFTPDNDPYASAARPFTTVISFNRPRLGLPDPTRKAAVSDGRMRRRLFYCCIRVARSDRHLEGEGRRRFFGAHGMIAG
jgi:hypothetical protein